MAALRLTERTDMIVTQVSSRSRHSLLWAMYSCILSRTWLIIINDKGRSAALICLICSNPDDKNLFSLIIYM